MIVIKACSYSTPYCSGGDERFDDYYDRLKKVTERYKRVLMVGDSMGATAALLFSPLATAVQVFSPQVRLHTESVCDIAGAHYCYRIHAVLRSSSVPCCSCPPVICTSWYCQHPAFCLVVTPNERRLYTQVSEHLKGASIQGCYVPQL